MRRGTPPCVAALGALQGRVITGSWGDAFSAWPWLGWLTPFGALWIPKWLVDDAMWALPRAGRVRRARWSGWWCRR